MPTYACYGLTIESTIPLPDLDTPRGSGDVARSVAADVMVAERAVGERHPAAVEVLPGLWSHRSAVWLEVPAAGRFEARDGTEIGFERRPGASDGDVRIFLLGTMLGTIMWQRGHLVLHGNAFRVGDAAAIVVGHSGAGKSTLAAELGRRGHDVLSDDVVPIDRTGRALPGYPRIKLWEHALTTLGLAPDDFERITPVHDKFHVPISRGHLEPLPVRLVYVLDTHDRPSLDLEPVSGLACFDLLHAHTYRGELIADHVAVWHHLQQCSALARQARVVRVVRPACTMTVVETADAILADVDRHLATNPQPQEARR